ncbi:MAG: epoxyqueuosine reductase QueH [Candidatus Omnitrophota bacterium]|jgi:hypothetical protein
MKILLHICCAPCLIYPLEKLRSGGFEARGVFYNPNIHGAAEYAARRQCLESYSASRGLEVEYPAYAPEEFFGEVRNGSLSPQRCVACWRLRMRFTARLARTSGIGVFSTTLLVSPYQDHALLREAAELAAEEEKVDFYYEDFRPGFRQARRQAGESGLYLQKYCGCIYSETERYLSKEKAGENAGDR